jgi:hypothetical protein
MSEVSKKGGGRKMTGTNGEFVLERDTFSDAFVSAAIFFDLPEGADGSLGVFPDCMPRILNDCARFQKENSRLLKKAYSGGCDEGGYGPYEAGRDFWLSRQGHWIGFATRGLGAVGQALAEAARGYRALYVLPGDAEDGGDEYIFIE